MDKAQTKVEDNFGWNDPSNSWDDQGWKDLDDDDDPMEPLEPTSYITQTKTSLSPLAMNKQSIPAKPMVNQNDWSNWTNDFEDENNQLKQQQPQSTLKAQKINNKTTSESPNPDSNANKPKLPATSSYNWSTTANNKGFDEEDLFSAIVKDISINNNNTVKSDFYSYFHIHFKFFNNKF
jgi:hypothetical protein